MYKVVRYFDTYLVGTEARNLTLEEAKRMRTKLSSENNKPYTTYEVLKEE